MAQHITGEYLRTRDARAVSMAGIAAPFNISNVWDDVDHFVAAVETDFHGRWGKPNRPLEDVVIERVEILEAPPLAHPAAEPSPPSRERDSGLGPEQPQALPALARR